MQQLTLAITPPPPRDFASFVAGANAAVLAHLQALAAPAAPAAPVYLWGPPGCGKTHLLQALAAERARSGGVGWFDAAAALPWSLPAAPALVVLDGCDAYDAARQHAAFALFVEATTLGLQVAAALRIEPAHG